MKDNFFNGLWGTLSNLGEGMTPFQKFLLSIGAIGLIERAAELVMSHSKPEAVKVVSAEEVGIETHNIEDVPN